MREATYIPWTELTRLVLSTTPQRDNNLQTLWELDQGKGTKDQVGYLWCVPKVAESQIWRRYRPASRELRAGQRRIADQVVGQEHFQLPTYTRHPLQWHGKAWQAWEGQDKKQPNRLGQFRRRLIWLMSRTDSHGTEKPVRSLMQVFLRGWVT